MKRRLTPQEKKALSYEHDRRNGYGENDKASRKAIPLRKAKEHRKTRREARSKLVVIDRLPSVAAETFESSLRQNVSRKGSWKKVPDTALGEHLDRQLARRSSR